MTNLHDIMRLHGTQLSNQQLADMALQEDQAARRAFRTGEHARALMHQNRVDALADMLT